MTTTAPSADQQALQELAARRQKALGLVAQGDASLAAGNAVKAAELYNQALQQVPEMPEARKGLTSAADLMNQSSQAAPLTELRQTMEIQRQQALVKFESDLKQARDTLQGATSGASSPRPPGTPTPPRASWRPTRPT